MGRRFAAVGELLDDALELPLGDRVYRIPSPPAEDGLRVQRIMDAAIGRRDGGEGIDTEALDDDEEADLYQLCLGPAFEEIKEAGASLAELKHIGLTAMFWIVAGEQAAEKYWTSGGDPSRWAPNRAAKRAAAKKSGSAAAKSTPRRGSTSGTNARKATASAPPAATT